jgi:uncharacterized protein (DUF2336 family)
MFLFSTPAAKPSQTAANPVVEAIRDGAAQTGTSFEYLMSTARRESALNPAAKAPTSSATGLFQFIEQTWLSLVKSDGPQHGLGEYADTIKTRSDGRVVVEDPEARREILKLREDPKVASVMAGTLTRKNRDALEADIGREPTAGELYMAHFLGSRGARDLVRSATENPNRIAASEFPDAAAANRSIFYERTGRPRTTAEVYGVLSATKGEAATPVVAKVEGTPAPARTVTGRADVAGFRGLFQNDNRQGPISDAVSKLWKGRVSAPRAEYAALKFFPRSTPIEPAAGGGGRDDASRHSRAPGCFPARGHSRSDHGRFRSGNVQAGRRAPAAAASTQWTRTPRSHGLHEASQVMIVRRFLLWARHAPPGDRAEAVGALTRAYLYSELSPEDRREAATALTSMLDDPSVLVRRTIAENLASSPDAPRHLVLALVSDSADIAELLLERSPVLADCDLVDAIALGDERAQRAVASRPWLSPAASAALAEIGSAAALVRLAGNSGAEIGESSLARMIERHGDKAELREALLARDDVPVELRQAIAVALSDALAAFVTECGWLSPQRTERALRDARERTAVTLSGSAEARDAQRLVLHLRNSGQLTPGLILRALLSCGHELR